MEILWFKKGYFGLLGNAHILVYYPIISYQRIEVYRDEKFILEYPAGTMMSVENTIPVSTTVLILPSKIF